MEAVSTICFSSFALVAAVIALIIAKAQSKHCFKCQNCAKEFQPKWTQLIFEMHVMNEHKIKCPFCHVKGFCQDKGRKAG